MLESSRSDNQTPPRLGAATRVVVLAAIAVVLGVAFMGYLSPDMKLQWENLMALCGF